MSSKNDKPITITSFFTAVFNLMNAILGAGIVGLPYAASNLGYIFFGIMIIIVGLIALYDIDLLLRLCKRLGTTSYEKIAVLSYGNFGKIYTCLVIFLHTLFAMCGFMFMVRYEGPPLIEGIIGYEKTCEGDDDLTGKPWYLNGTYLVFITIIGIVAPLASLKNIDFLGYTSGLGMFCMLAFTAVVIVYKFLITCPVTAYDGAQDFFETFSNISSNSGNSEENSNSNCTVEDLYEDYAIEFYDLAQNQTCGAKSFTWTGQSVYALPNMLFAFQCHASCLPIYAELPKKSIKLMMKISFTAISAVLIIYCLCSYFAYFTWYNVTMEEVLMMYTSLNPSDPLIIIARLCILICVILSAPLLHYPCRKSVIKLFWKDDVEFSWIRHLLIMICILILVTVLVILLPGIQVIFGYAGAITANSLMLILPNLFYFKNGEPEKKVKRYVSLVAAVIGIIIMVGNTILLALEG